MKRIPEHQRPCNAHCRKLHDAIDGQLSAYNAGRDAALQDVALFNAAGEKIARELRKSEAVTTTAPARGPRCMRFGDLCPMCLEYPVEVGFAVLMFDDSEENADP